MKRGRKPATLSPKLFNGVPLDQYLRSICEHSLEWNGLPNAADMRRLAEFFLAVVPKRKMTGPEVAALLEQMIVEYNHTLPSAIQWLSTNGDFTVEALQQHHKRYGKSMHQLNALKATRQNELELERKSRPPGPLLSMLFGSGDK